MKRTTDKLIALQFLAVVLPISVVLLVQMVYDAHRAQQLAYSRPLRILADSARASFKTFTNGAADAVDTGALGPQSVEALHAAAARLSELAMRHESLRAGDAAAAVSRLAAGIPRRAALATLLPLREEILNADALTKAVDDEFEKRDQDAVKSAIDSAVLQQRAVIAAMIVTAGITAWFVLATRRRLKASLDADMAAERARRAELETISVRFGIATGAARAGVYEFKEGGIDLWWSDTMYELYGRSLDTRQPNIDSWLAMIHPEDRQSAQAAIVSAFLEGSQLRSQHRVVRPDGTVCHMASLAAVVADACGAGRRLIGIDLDITERVEADDRERQLQQRLRDASRQAGMAEVATNVLHNVGNVLNSVNISANVVADQVKSSKLAGLRRVARLLEDHAGDLGAFLSNDDRGKHVPTYLAQLTEQLSLDQSVTLKEVELLRKNVDHIKEIVTMQQSYSKLVGVPERVDLESLADDALRMNAGAFSRHGVRVKCEFECVPEIVVEKHKVLQILVNLLRNAKYACEASGKPDKEVILKVAAGGDLGVQISVRDNGIGIDALHMPQLFRHGFTTKKDGHGFGLHSGALAAREMGGVLRAASDGRGKGAVFTLELPLNAKEMVHA